MSARIYAQTIGAGETIRLPNGRYFYIKTATAALNLTASGNTSSPANFANIGAGTKFGPVAEGEGWRFLDVFSASAQNIEIAISDDGNFEIASAVTVSGSVTTAEAPSSAFTSPAAVNILDATSQDFAANLSRKRITLCANSTNTLSLWVRDQTGTTSVGIELQPGMTMEFKTTAAFRVRNNSGAAQNFTWIEET